MMDKIRLILIISHVLIPIFLMYHLHPKVLGVGKPSETERRVSLMIVYLNDLFRIALYHSSCIIAIWYSGRYAAAMIRATGVLLIGEFFEMFSTSILHLVEIHKITHGELVFDGLYVCLFFGAIILTYRLAKKISKFNKDSMHAELLTTTTMSDLEIDGQGEFSLV
jgi:hypothetical protein